MTNFKRFFCNSPNKINIVHHIIIRGGEKKKRKRAIRVTTVIRSSGGTPNLFHIYFG